ncbi:MAG: hypothetical protein R2854_04715 [Caldilineaceae bacterium]
MSVELLDTLILGQQDNIIQRCVRHDQTIERIARPEPVTRFGNDRSKWLFTNAETDSVRQIVPNRSRVDRNPLNLEEILQFKQNDR